jgi:hypothetical protein
MRNVCRRAECTRFVLSGKCLFVSGDGIVTPAVKCGDLTLRTLVTPGSDFLPFSAKTGEGSPSAPS